MMKSRELGNKNRIAWIILLLTGLGLLMLSNADCASLPIRIDGYVYDSCGGCFTQDNPCKPCKVVLELEAYLSSELARLGIEGECTVKVYNLLFDEPRKLFSDRLFEHDSGSMEYPVLFLNDTALYGWEQIKKDFAPILLEYSGKVAPGTSALHEKEILLEKSESDIVVYFKMKSCGSCENTQEYLDRLFQRYGHVRLLTMDIEEQGNLEIFQAYCRMYGTDADTMSVPAIFIGNRSLEGYDEISLFLDTYLEAGYAHNTYCFK